MPTNAECEAHRKDIYQQLNANDKTLAEIKGGVKVLVWLLPLVFTFVCGILGVMVKQRFDSIERQLEELGDRPRAMQKTATTTATQPGRN